MANLEPVVLEGRTYQLRHIGPKAQIWPQPPVAVSTYALLNQSAMVARSLPWSNQPNSADWVTGQWTGRLNDSSDFTLTFPNKEASDGGPWRLRFDPGGKKQWIEIWNDGYLEHVGCIQKGAYQRDSVVISGNDGWFQLKAAYERDWTVIQSPRDVIDRGTRVWQTLIADNFNYLGASVPDTSQWIASSSVEAGPNSVGTRANDSAWNPLGTSSLVPWTFGGSSSISTTSTNWVGSDGLVATNFGFSVPGGTSILGLQATIESNINLGGSVGGGAGLYAPFLVVSGTRSSVYTALRETGTPFPLNTNGFVYFGDSVDTWYGAAAALTPALVNASNFGYEFQVEIQSDGVHTMTWTVVALQMTVWYASSTAVQIRATGGLGLNVSSTPNNTAAITSVPMSTNSTIWVGETTVFQLPASGAIYSMVVLEDGNTVGTVQIAGGVATLFTWDPMGVSFTTMAAVNLTSSATWDIRIECDGEWTSGFVNGQLIGTFRRQNTVPSNLSMLAEVISTGTAANAVVTAALLEVQEAFLMRTDWQRNNPNALATSSVDNSGTGTVTWTNPGNVTNTGINSANAFANLGQNIVSHYLWITGFGFNVPSNATITGTEMRLLKSSAGTSNAVQDITVTLVNAGSTIGSNRAIGGVYWLAGTTAGTYTSYGGLTDQWGASLTPTIANSSTFGVAISCKNVGFAGTASAEIWNPAQAVIYYTLPGGDWGDFVLPGDASTYPWGGLHARYSNNLDLQSDTNRLRKIHTPLRTQAFSGSGVPEYANQQDATINGQQNPMPGADTSSWSVIWFGSIYLKSSAGDYTFSVNQVGGGNSAVRVWVGKTRFGEQLVDQWNWSNSGVFSFTISATALAGSLPYGAGTVTRDGWYPIKIEYAVDTTAQTAPVLHLTNSPVAYTDPGGTAIASGAQNIVVPATSLSPLGMIDQRYQGIAHFDLVQRTAQGFGYQTACEPLQLETLGQAQPLLGSFPGVLAPRIREGHDTDAILKPDIDPRTDGEGLIDYANNLDATDNCTSLTGNGAGFQSGTSGQLQAEVYDPVSMMDSLFDIQGWQDFSDASFASLLQALLNSELGLRLQPWQVVTGQPQGKPRLAYTWPLPSALAQMRWRPGDGLRVQAREVNIFDLSPRQILSIVRSIHPNGSTGAQVNFAARPRTPAHTLKQQLFGVSRWQRNYQKQLITLQSDMGAQMNSPAITSGGFGPYFGVSLLPSDQVVRAWIRIAYNTGTAGLEINAVDQTVNLNGPWTGVPVIINVTPYTATASATGLLYCRVINKGGTTQNFEVQLLIDVLR